MEIIGYLFFSWKRDGKNNKHDIWINQWICYYCNLFDLCAAMWVCVCVSPRCVLLQTWNSTGINFELFEQITIQWWMINAYKNPTRTQPSQIVKCTFHLNKNVKCANNIFVENERIVSKTATIRVCCCSNKPYQSMLCHERTAERNQKCA